MHKYFTYLFSLLLLMSPLMHAAPYEDLPVAYKGRFRPIKAYAVLENKKILELWNDHPKDLRVLPGKMGNGFWHTLQDLEHSPNNFTRYTDKEFEKIRTHYLQLKNKKISQQEAAQLSELLWEGYIPIAGEIYLRAHEKNLSYPTLNQLKAERIYYSYPLILWCLALYTCAALLLVFKNRVAVPTLLIAFALHTSVLALRCYILSRPPVANMFETVVYVPWIAVLISLGLYIYSKNRLLLLASTCTAVILLSILEITHLNNELENVQAVLDSQFWLMIHVLMVVGSYGLFILSGALGHLYLFGWLKNRSESPWMQAIAKLTLQSMYLGVALLVPGTILGGVWAAESWGRFWDWDPKEAWAFISICTYLICVHMFRFKHIGNFGLAICSIAGLLVISFTWYGVNYILGTGLHSYGFGSGGEIYYYLYCAAEIGFIGIVGFLVQLKGRPKWTRMDPNGPK